MVRAREKTKWTEVLLPVLVSLFLQVIGGVWFASHVNAQTEQNTKDIQEMRTVVVPRPEITQGQQDIRERMDEMDRKLDLLVARKDP